MDQVKIEGIKPGKGSQRDIARRQYSKWQWRTKESKLYKAILFVLCEGECPKCGVDMVLAFSSPANSQNNAATLDHTIPLAKTLKHSKYGLEIMCKKCNQVKSDKII